MRLTILIVLSLWFTMLSDPVAADIFRTVSEDGVVYFTNAPTDREAKVVIREAKTAKPQSRPRKTVAPKQEFSGLVEEKARLHDLDPRLVKAVIRAESNWNPRAVSPKGALGLMQLMPGTARDMGVNNPFDPAENIDGGVRYLKYLLQKFDGNLTLSLAAYNAGPGLVERTRAVPPIPETVSYVRRVVESYSGEPGALATVPSDRKERSYRVVRVVLDDGTVLYTNLYPPAAGSLVR